MEFLMKIVKTILNQSTGIILNGIILVVCLYIYIIVIDNIDQIANLRRTIYPFSITSIKNIKSPDQEIHQCRPLHTLLNYSKKKTFCCKSLNVYIIIYLLYVSLILFIIIRSIRNVTIIMMMMSQIY